MIVDPDFPDHWRTRMAVDLLDGDEMAPLYILRIWGHCQQRRSDRFDGMPAAGLKALCKYPGNASKLEAALIEARFIERNGDMIIVPKWSEKNASLIAAWGNGSLGGRPKKEPNQNPRVTQVEPTENPEQTNSKPIREESREEKEEKAMSGKPDVAPSPDSPAGLLAYLNAKAGKAFRPVDSNLGRIAARLKTCSPDDVRAVIDSQVAKWGRDDKMAEYLRPETLFGALKFESYLGNLPAASAHAAPGGDPESWRKNPMFAGVL